MKEKKVYITADNGKLLGRCNNCGPSNGNQNSVAVHANVGDGIAAWTAEVIDGKCAFKSDIGKYMASCNNCWQSSKYPISVFTNIDNAFNNQNAQWTLERFGELFAFKSNNGKYLGRCNNCVQYGVNPDFAFVFVENPQEKIALFKIDFA